MTNRRVRAVRKYTEFHEVAPAKVERIEVDTLGIPPVLVKLGTLESLVYQPAPPSRRAGYRYEHEFGDYGLRWRGRHKPILACDPEGRNLYIIKGRSAFHVEKRGIVG